MLPPPGYGTSSVNQQSNQLLGKPGVPAVGKPAPALGAAVNRPALSPNPLTAPPPQIANIVKLLKGQS